MVACNVGIFAAITSRLSTVHLVACGVSAKKRASSSLEVHYSPVAGLARDGPEKPTKPVKCFYFMLASEYR